MKATHWSHARKTAGQPLLMEFQPCYVWTFPMFFSASSLEWMVFYSLVDRGGFVLKDILYVEELNNNVTDAISCLVIWGGIYFSRGLHNRDVVASAEFFIFNFGGRSMG